MFALPVMSRLFLSYDGVVDRGLRVIYYGQRRHRRNVVYTEFGMRT